jgi:hypothetical protein
MADIKSPPEREHDKRILIGIVTDIGDQLRIIVFERQDLFRTEFRPFFPGPWRDVEARLSRAVHDLEHDNFNWDYVEGAGLVRDGLQFKRSMLTAAIKQGVAARVLKIINSILGSLTGVFPFLEAVKEYKEHVEAAIAIQNRWRP